MTPCEGPAGLFSGNLLRKKNQPLDLLMSRPLMPSPLTQSVEVEAKVRKQEAVICRSLNVARFVLGLQSLWLLFIVLRKFSEYTYIFLMCFPNEKNVLLF